MPVHPVLACEELACKRTGDPKYTLEEVCNNCWTKDHTALLQRGERQQSREGKRVAKLIGEALPPAVLRTALVAVKRVLGNKDRQQARGSSSSSTTADCGAAAGAGPHGCSRCYPNHTHPLQ
jgi:hypothetical protein